MSARPGHRSAAGAVLALLVAGCTQSPGAVNITNDATAPADVQLSATEIERHVPDGGGVSIFTHDCFEGPLVVTFTDGRTFRVEDDICPGQELVIKDDGAALRQGDGSTP